MDKDIAISLIDLTMYEAISHVMKAVNITHPVVDISVDENRMAYVVSYSPYDIMGDYKYQMVARVISEATSKPVIIKFIGDAE